MGACGVKQRSRTDDAHGFNAGVFGHADSADSIRSLGGAIQAVERLNRLRGFFSQQRTRALRRSRCTADGPGKIAGQRGPLRCCSRHRLSNDWRRHGSIYHSREYNRR